MSFAYIKYGKELKCGSIKKQYIRLFGKAKINKMEGFGGRGLEAVMPYGRGEQDIRLMSAVKERMFEGLRRQGIKTAAAEDYISLPMDFEKCGGRYINAAFADEMVKDTAQKTGINLNDADIVIKDGGDEESLEAIVKIARCCGRLNINTDRRKELEPFLEKIYNETGLCAGCFADSFGKIMREADMVISCLRGADKNKSCKKGAVYVGIFSPKECFEELNEKRNDLKIFGCPVYDISGEETDGKLAEAFLADIIFEKNMIFSAENIRLQAENAGVKYKSLKFSNTLNL
jgi:hypothetical protein